MKHKGMLSIHGLRTGVGAGLLVIATVALSPLASGGRRSAPRRRKRWQAARAELWCRHRAGE